MNKKSIEETEKNYLPARYVVYFDWEYPTSWIRSNNARILPIILKKEAFILLMLKNLRIGWKIQ